MSDTSVVCPATGGQAYPVLTTRPEIGGPCGAIYLSYLVLLHHTLVSQLRRQASTLTHNDTGPVGPVTPSIYWSCKNFTGPIFFL